jgi:MFS family permease
MRSRPAVPARPTAWLASLGGGLDRRFALLVAAMFTGFVGIGAILPALPLHVTGNLGAGDIELGVVIGAFSIAALATRLVSGRFVDRKGPRLALQLGLAVCSIGGFLFLVPAGLPGVIAARLVQGFGDAFLFTAGAAWTIDLAPSDRRAQALGLLALGIWGGLALGPAVGAVLGGYAATALFVGLMPIPVVVALGRPRGRRADRAGSPGDRPRPRLLPREALRPGIALGLVNVGYATLAGFLVLRLAETGGGGSAAFGAFAAAVLVARILLPTLVDRRGPAFGMILGTTVFASGLVLVAVAPSPTIGVLAAALCGLGYALPWPSIATFTLSRVGEHERGSALGVLTLCYDAAVFVGAIGAGVVAHAAGYPEVFWLAAGAVAAATVVVLPVMLRERRAGLPTRSPTTAEVGLTEA